MQQSQQFVQEINGFARSAGGTAEDSTMLKGKFHRGFMDTKALGRPATKAASSVSNTYGEAWAIKAYVEALASPDLTGPARQAVERQHQTSHQTLHKLAQLKGIEGVGQGTGEASITSTPKLRFGPNEVTQRFIRGPSGPKHGFGVRFFG